MYVQRIHTTTLNKYKYQRRRMEKKETIAWNTIRVPQEQRVPAINLFYERTQWQQWPQEVANGCLDG